MDKTVHDVFSIPRNMVLGFGDIGTSYSCDDDDTPKSRDHEDLRFTIELNGGHLIVLEPNQHMRIDMDAVTIIQWSDSSG